MFDGMTTLVDSLPFAGRGRLRAGDAFITRELTTLAFKRASAAPRAKYGVHADDQWSIDQLLALAESAAASEVRA